MARTRGRDIRIPAARPRRQKAYDPGGYFADYLSSPALWPKDPESVEMQRAAALGRMAICIVQEYRAFYEDDAEWLWDSMPAQVSIGRGEGYHCYFCWSQGDNTSHLDRAYTSFAFYLAERSVARTRREKPRRLVVCRTCGRFTVDRSGSGVRRHCSHACAHRAWEERSKRKAPKKSKYDTFRATEPLGGTLECDPADDPNRASVPI